MAQAGMTRLWRGVSVRRVGCDGTRGGRTGRFADGYVRMCFASADRGARNACQAGRPQCLAEFCRVNSCNRRNVPAVDDAEDGVPRASGRRAERPCSRRGAVSEPRPSANGHRRYQRCVAAARTSERTPPSECATAAIIARLAIANVAAVAAAARAATGPERSTTAPSSATLAAAPRTATVSAAPAGAAGRAGRAHLAPRVRRHVRLRRRAYHRQRRGRARPHQHDRRRPRHPRRAVPLAPLCRAWRDPRAGQPHSCQRLSARMGTNPRPKRTP